MDQVFHFLQKVKRSGWTNRLEAEFRRKYGDIIARSILFHVKNCFGSIGLTIIAQKVNLMIGISPSESTVGQGVRQEPLDVGIETAQCVLFACFQAENHLLLKYESYAQQKGDQSKSFEDYLKTQVSLCFNRYLSDLHKSISHGRSQKEILDAIVDSVKEDTRHDRIREMRDLYGDALEHALRTKFPHHRNSSSIKDYFFERFILDVYPSIRNQLDPARPGHALHALIEAFSEQHTEEGSRYIRQVYGRKPTFTHLDDDLLPDLSPQNIPVDNPCHVYWDQLIRCQTPSPDEIEASVLRQRHDYESAMCWACAQEKRARNEKSKENVVALIVFYCSKRDAPGRSDVPASQLSPKDLSLELVVGRNFTEEEVQQIFKKTIKLSRERERLKARIRSSRYRNLFNEPQDAKNTQTKEKKEE